MTILEINAETQEAIEREATKQEIEQREIDAAESVVKKEASLAKATAKAELLARLGITADEAALLLG